jgi:hypothetical protein
MVLAKGCPPVGKADMIGNHRQKLRSQPLPTYAPKKAPCQNRFLSDFSALIEEIIVAGSIPMAMAGSESVSRLINNRCTEQKEWAART